MSNSCTFVGAIWSDSVTLSLQLFTGSVELKGRKVLLFSNMELFEDETENLSIDKLGNVVFNPL